MLTGASLLWRKAEILLAFLRGFPGRNYGSASFARDYLTDLHLRWYDHWLKGIQPSVRSRDAQRTMHSSANRRTLSNWAASRRYRITSCAPASSSSCKRWRMVAGEPTSPVAG